MNYCSPEFATPRNWTFGKVSNNVEPQTHILPPDPGARFRTFYIVRSCLQPYGGPINWKDSRCRDLDPDFEFFGVEISGTILPQDLGGRKNRYFFYEPALKNSLGPMISYDFPHFYLPWQGAT